MKRFAYLFVALTVVVFTLAAAGSTEASWFLERYGDSITLPDTPDTPDTPITPDPGTPTEPPAQDDSGTVYYGGWARKWLQPAPDDEVPVPDEPAPAPGPAPAPEPEPAPEPAPPSDDQRGTIDPVDSATSQEQQVLQLVNKEREAEGLDPLKLDLTLTRLARMKATDLVENNVFTHTSPTYGDPIQMLKTYGITYKSMGENLGTAGSIWVVHYRLMASPGHRENIMDPNFTHVGIGVVPNGGGVLVCELFVQW